MGRIQTGVFDNLIRRLYSIKGGGSELSETLGDLFPILDLENLPSELLVLRGWHMFSGFATVVGIAAQQANLQLFNPATSTSIVVLTKIIVHSQKSADCTYGVNIPLATPVIATFNLDTRIPQLANANARIAADANSAAVGNAGFLSVAAQIDREFTIPNGIAVLGPGGVFTLSSPVNDNDLTVVFIGRERLAEPSELSF